jgi:hypothetical protein
MNIRRVLLVVAIAWAVVMLHRGEPLAWDEIEFFRATRWVAEGKLPFRDYWEHHMPLQWLAFAPVARVFGGGAGVDAVVALRWAQVPLWIGIFFLLRRLARHEGVGDWGFWAATAALLVSPEFVRSALQYRVDVPGNLAFVAALVLLVRDRAAWFGVLMSAAVLANVRLAPLAMLAGVVALVRWRASRRTGAMLLAVAISAAVFTTYLFATGSWDGFRDGVFDYNRISDALKPPEANTFWSRLAAPFVQLDLGAIAFWLAAVAGAVRRKPSLLLVLAIGSLITTASTGVQYPYHFQTAYILLIPTAALGFEWIREKWRVLVPAVVAVALVVDISRVSFAGMRYQNEVMQAVDAHTSPAEKVFDGCGYALRRPPAYRYWFLPAGVRLMAEAKKIEPYDLPQLLADPPAAIVYNARVHYWLLAYPKLALYVLRHYIPLYRNLWIPGMTAAVGPRERSVTFIVPKSGRYDVYASALLARHPWIVKPLSYGDMVGSELEIPLVRLPKIDGLEWRVNGQPVTTLDLERGDRLELTYRGAVPAGVLVVPAGTATLCSTPDERFVF